MVRSAKGYRNEGTHSIQQLNAEIKKQFTSDDLATITRQAFGKNWSRLTKNQKYELLITNKVRAKDRSALEQFLENRFPKPKAELEFPKVTRSQGAALFALKIPHEELVECIYKAAKMGLTLMSPTVENIQLLSSLVKRTGYMIPLSLIVNPAPTETDLEPHPRTETGYHFFGIYKKNPGHYFLKREGFSIKDRAVAISLSEDRPDMAIKAFVFEKGVLNQFLLD